MSHPFNNKIKIFFINLYSWWVLVWSGLTITLCRTAETIYPPVYLTQVDCIQDNSLTYYTISPSPHHKFCPMLFLYFFLQYHSEIHHNIQNKNSGGGNGHFGASSLQKLSISILNPCLNITMTIMYK